jgi:phosphatidylglycerophosphate synthase
MTAKARHSAIRLGTLAIGAALFAGALYYVKVEMRLETVRRLGSALPLALLFSGLWHLARTWAWAACFPQPRQVGFLHLARVRLSAEAFSYLTFGGIVGDPLKVALLSESIDARQAAAAVALERFAFLAGTTMIVGLGAILAMVGLPVTPLWFRVFRGLAIGAAAVSLMIIVVVRGRATYCQRVLRQVDAALAPAFGKGRIVGFTLAVKQQMLDVVRSNPRCLLVLAAATGASYVLMALEAYVIVRASSASFTPNGALAVETLSRAASFASAFIPANFGALEASSVAAVAAVGAAGAGLALALARRIRGIFWAGVGLAIYPRTARQTLNRAAGNETADQARATLIYIPNAPSLSVPPTATLAGLPIAERVVRAAVRAGYTRVVVWAPDLCGQTRLTRRLRSLARQMSNRVHVVTVPRDWELAIGSLDPADDVTVVGAGTVISPALLASAREIRAEAGRSIDVAPGPAWPESGVIRMTAGDAHDYEAVARALASRLPRGLPMPSGVDVSMGRALLAIRIADPAQRLAAEETIRRASYKDTDAKIARFNRRISLPISVALIPTPLTANQLSVILVAIGFYSAWLFSFGHYWTGVLAAFLSLAASVLDGCDGEIARLKYQESALGCWIETVGDYSYYLAIFAGLTIGAVRQTHLDAFYWLGGVALTGTLLSFAILIFLRARITDGRPEKLHTVARARFKSTPTFWSRVIWRVSFVATRAAMPYGIFALALVYMLPGVVVLAAIGANVYWISLVSKMRRLLGRPEAMAAA